jgi:hypothetical protein
VMGVRCSSCCSGYAAAAFGLHVPNGGGGGVVASGLQPLGEWLCMGAGLCRQGV